VSDLPRGDDAPPRGTSAPPSFLADAMLGGLARWLRVLDIDTAFDPTLADAELVRRALAEGRVILTRDRKLLERRLARRHVLVASEAIGEQLRQVLDTFGLVPRAADVLSRCLRCNTPLAALSAEAAAGRVPVFVLRTQTSFRECPRCQRVYWRATHVERMRQRLRSFGIALT
jgi:uncharacterized protein with PIN domain